VKTQFGLIHYQDNQQNTKKTAPPSLQQLVGIAQATPTQRKRNKQTSTQKNHQHIKNSQPTTTNTHSAKAN
jgi:hypothetical protein